MFKNGTASTDYGPVNMTFAGWDGTQSGPDVPLSTFVRAFAPAAVNSTLEWCQLCGTTDERGCATALAAAQETAGAQGHSRISKVGAGFLGAGLTAAVFLMALGVLAFLGVLTVGGRRYRKRHVSQSKENIRGQGGDVELHSEVSLHLDGLNSADRGAFRRTRCLKSTRRDVEIIYNVVRSYLFSLPHL